MFMLKLEIREDIDGRRRLLTEIKTLYVRYQFNNKDEDLYLIFSIPSVYSIWEGFVQTSFKIYIQELNKLNLAVNAISEPILVYSIEKRFKQFKEYPADLKKKAVFFNKLNQFYASDSIEIDGIVNTESNVGFKVLNKLLETFCLETIPEYIEPGVSLKHKLDKFLKIRNMVAHGQYSEGTIKREELGNAIQLVSDLMELVTERIINGFKNESYLIASKNDAG
jgi:hypothetical protein